MTFSRDNIHKEFKCSSVMVDRNLFSTKESLEDLLSALQLVIGIGQTQLMCSSNIRGHIEGGELAEALVRQAK